MIVGFHSYWRSPWSYVADRLTSHASTVGGQLHTSRYDYDSAERLAQIKYIKAEGQAGEQLIEQIDYGYDAKGKEPAKPFLTQQLS